MGHQCDSSKGKQGQHYIPVPKPKARSARQETVAHTAGESWPRVGHIEVT